MTYRHKRSSEGLGTMRTMEALLSETPTPEQEEQRKGQLNAPLIHLPLTHVVPDELHLMLRITDVLTRNLIKGALAYDAQKSGDISAVLKRPMISKLLKCIRNCGVGFEVYLEADGGFKFTSLVGGDKKKLLFSLPSKLLTCQPPLYHNTVKQIWEVRINIHLFYCMYTCHLRNLQIFTKPSK